MPEQRNLYRAGRPWLRLGFKAPDRAVHDLILVADTGSPAGLIIREDLFERLTHKRIADATGTFGPMRGGWLRLYSPDVGVVEFVRGYASDEAARRVGRSSLEFVGLVGLPVLRLGEYGGDHDSFWFRSTPNTPAGPS